MNGIIAIGAVMANDDRIVLGKGLAVLRGQILNVGPGRKDDAILSVLYRDENGSEIWFDASNSDQAQNIINQLHGIGTPPTVKRQSVAFDELPEHIQDAIERERRRKEGEN